MPTHSNLVGRYIKDKREEANVSQADLAKALGLSSGQSISNIERGRSPLPAKAVGPIADLLQLDRYELIERMVQDYREQLFVNAIKSDIPAEIRAKRVRFI